MGSKVLRFNDYQWHKVLDSYERLLDEEEHSENNTDNTGMEPHSGIYLRGVIFTLLWRIQNNAFRSALFWLLGESISMKLFTQGRVRTVKSI